MIVVQKIKHDAPDIRDRIFTFLAPWESHALFILGNLTNHFPDSHLYVAQDNGEWLGIAGYYARPRSMIPFARNPEVVRLLVRHVAERHSPILYMNGIDYAAQPAYDELLAMGFQPDNDPHQVFLELRQLPPQQAHEATARPMEERDLDDVARLLRLLRNNPDMDAPVTQAERDNAGLNAMRYCSVS